MKSLSQFFSFLLQEEATKSNWKIQELKELDNIDDVRSYIYDKFTLIANGSGRNVYAVDDKLILKVAKSPYLSEQNENELKHATCLGPSHAPIIYDYDHKHFYWLLEERLEPIEGKELFDRLNALLGHQFTDWLDLRNFFANTHLPDYSSGVFTRLYHDSPWLKKLVDELRTCDVDADDFHDENWGIRPSTRELVLLDLGF